MGVKKKTLAIVGTGASGVTCFIQLVLKHIVARVDQPLSIVLFEKRDEFGPGLAYGTGQEDHLLNTHAGLMGIVPEEPLHFVQWMHTHQNTIRRSFEQDSIHPDAYPARLLYGKYVREMLEQYIQKAVQHGISVSRENTEIIDAVIKADQSVMLKAADGSGYAADYVILATGNPEPSSFKKLLPVPAYVPSPWPASRILSTVKRKDAVVGIVGSSLTALDAAITLVENGHRGGIRFFSLEGLLPTVQSPEEQPYDRRVLTIANIRKLIRENQRQLRVKDLIRLFRAEVEQHVQRRVDWRAENRIGRDQLALLVGDIEDAIEGKNVFQNILYSMRYDTYAIWKLLPVDQKLLFNKWIKAEVDIYRHAIPMENGIKLKQLLESGQLQVIGNSDDIEWNGQQFMLRTEDGKVHYADVVVNASGPAAAINEMDDLPLLQRLLERGYIQEYGAGGLVADLNTLRVTPPGKTHAPFYAIGHPLLGQQHDINALWFNVAQADKLTNDLLAKSLSHSSR